MLIKSVFAVSLAVLAVAYILFYIYLAPISNVIVVGFDGFRGINLLGTTENVFAILTSGGVLVFINLVLSSVLIKRDLFLSALLAFVSLALAVLILISVGVIIASN